MNFVIARRFAIIEQFVFLDESSAKTNMTRLYGRAPIGQRCSFAAPSGHWNSTTMLSAIRSSGVIPEARIVFDGATNSTIFRGYVEQCLAPELRAGDTAIKGLDRDAQRWEQPRRLSSHKVTGVCEAIESVGANVWYLPPYSPDLNPIEKLWSKVKSWLRRAAARTINNLIKAIGQVLRKVDANECKAYFHSCEYATPEC